MVRNTCVNTGMNKWQQFFKDDTGQYSSTRLIFIVSSFLILGVWLVSCYHQKKMADLPSSLLYLEGILMTGKIGQSFSENLPPKS